MRIRLSIFISIVVAGFFVSSTAHAQLRDYLPEWLGGTPSQPPRRSTPAPPRSTPAPQLVCLGTTNTRDLSIENALRQPINPSYAYQWSRPGTRERFIQACQRDVVASPPMNRANTNAIRTVASIGNRHVDRTCIRQAIRARANDNIDANRTMCGRRARQTSGTPCLSDRYVDFLHYTINSALRCLQSRDNPLDPDTIFEMLNHESAFMGFVNNTGGVGLAQMTSMGVRGVFDPGHGGRENLDALMARSEKQGFCAPFRRLVRPLGRQSIPVCQYTEIDDGIAQSAIAGIGLFSYYQTVVTNALVDAGIPRSHPKFAQMQRALSLISYNSGETDALRLLDRIKGTLRTSRDPVAYIRQQANSRLGKDYVGAMANSRSQVPGIPASCATTRPM